MSVAIGDWAACFSRRGGSLRRVALVTATWFAAVGALWIVALDLLLRARSRDPVMVARLESTIHWAFILITSAAVYTIAYRIAVQLKRMHDVTVAVVESIGDAVLVLGRDRTIVYANPAAARMLDAKTETIVGLTAAEFSRRFLVQYPNGMVVTPDEFVAQRVFTEQGPLRYKVVLHPTERREVVVRSTASAVRPRPGAPPALVVSVMHDVTPNENLSRMRDRFLSSAAHALKTPVAIIKANVQLIARGEEVAGPSFQAIERQCARIDRLVQNLMVVSRARSHSLRLHAHRLALAQVVHEIALEVVTMRLPSEVRTEISASPVVYGDTERLATLVRNLCGEAIGAAVRGSPVTLYVSQPDRMTAELGVRYQPIPIPERTFSGDEDYDDTPLAHCATTTIAEAHGGTFGEESAGTTATLWVRLPAIEEHDVGA